MTHTTTRNPVHVNTRDCQNEACGEAIPVRVEYEVDGADIHLHAVDEPTTCHACGASTDGPGGRAFMVGLAAEIRATLRAADAAAQETARSRRIGPWD